jgi:uncharacterized protein
MKIAIAGGTGFVGEALVNELLKNNHHVVILTRKWIERNNNERIRYVQWLTAGSSPVDSLQDTEVFINLAGESINSGRWTSSRKAKILNSRLEAVEALLDIFSKLERKPKVLINASAIGIYGTSSDTFFTEVSPGAGNDLLSKTVNKWESSAVKAATFGIRPVLCRFGIILDKHKGALPKMAMPYKAFIGGNIGNGQQWMSWIHIEDVVKAIVFVINNEKIEGPINFTAPNPVMMKDFGKILSSVLHRPHWLPVPRFALRTLLGEMSTLVVDGQKVFPQMLIDNNYQFIYPELHGALKNIFT